tara:strand:+ start:3308 stop:4765 length:1458 start_codon:yes stop_codon:yes gene_type:complete
MNYAIACGHKITAQAAEDVLQLGGNAVDAAIAAFATSWIAEPCMSGPGGGAFATIRIDNKVFTLDCFANTPSVKKPKEEVQYIPVNVDFGDTTELFYSGFGSIAVPGAIDGIFKLHEIGGTLPIKDLLYPAIQNAKAGVTLNDFQHYDLHLLRDIIGHSSRGKEIFFGEDELVPIGTNIAMPYLADFLEFLSFEGRDAFYQGEIASNIAKISEENGGHISLNDLKNYKAQLSNALNQKFHQKEIFTIGSPSIGGSMLVRLLQIFGKEMKYCTDRLVLALEKFENLKKSGVFDKSIVDLGGLKKGGTSHISIVDQNKNAISLSMSLGEGSGCFVPGTDIHLNNMLGEESLLPNGIHSWRENARMSSMMTPTILLDNKEGQISALGSGGASRIPTMIGQVIYHSLIGLNNISDAISHPRVHFVNDVWQSEPGFQRPMHLSPDDWFEWQKPSLFFGGTHCAAAINKKYIAVGDSRRSGVGVLGQRYGF